MVPSFERLPLSMILRRNFGRRSRMIAVMVRATEMAIGRGVDEDTRREWMREAIRPFDRYAAQKGALQ